MLIKFMTATAALALTLTAAHPIGQAEAKSNVDINIGIGFGGFVAPDYGYHEPHYVSDHSPGLVSCSKARKVVRWNGFYNVKALDCSAPNYRFSGWRDGEKYSIKVNNWGDITRISSY